MRTLVALLTVPTLLAIPLAPVYAQDPAPAAAAPAIKAGSRVGIEYTLTDEGGKVLDTNKGQEPFTYTHGEHQIVPGLETALAGKRAGNVAKVTVKPEEGYGKVDPKAQIEVGRERVPPDIKVGSELTGRTASGDT